MVSDTQVEKMCRASKPILGSPLSLPFDVLRNPKLSEPRPFEIIWRFHYTGPIDR